MIYDTAIIGTGPAGLSAALNLQIHNKSILWIGSKKLSDKVTIAQEILNYPGYTGITGKGLNDLFRKQVKDMDIDIVEQMVNSIMPYKGHFALMAGSDLYEAKTIILATGIATSGTIIGESGYLGKGVSYCATCDGHLYKDKTIAIVCNNERFEHEVTYLAELAKKVYYIPSYKYTLDLPENIEVIRQRPVEILGDKKASGIKMRDASEITVDGIFCLRDSVTLASLLSKLEVSDGHIVVTRAMETNIPGVYAAGDNTGRPYQYAKAVGEGNVAAHSVIQYLAERKKEEKE